MSAHFSNANGGPQRVDLESAVSFALTPRAYSFNTDLERAEQKAELAADMLVRLLKALIDDGALREDSAAHVIGVGWHCCEEA